MSDRPLVIKFEGGPLGSKSHECEANIFARKSERIHVGEGAERVVYILKTDEGDVRTFAVEA